MPGTPSSPSPVDSSVNAPLDPGLFVDTRGWADESSDVRKMNAAGRNGALEGAVPQRKMKKDDTGNLGLEELLEGGDESTGHKPRGKNATGSRPLANTSMPSPKMNQTSGRLAALVPGDDPTAATKPKKKTATAQVAVVVVVLMLVLASAGMAIYYFKH